MRLRREVWKEFLVMSDLVARFPVAAPPPEAQAAAGGCRGGVA